MSLLASVVGMRKVVTDVIALQQQIKLKGAKV